jgi:hypothetical protein
MDPDYAFLANLPDPSVSSTSVFYSITRPQTRLCLGLDYFTVLRAAVLKEYPQCTIPSGVKQVSADATGSTADVVAEAEASAEAVAEAAT